MGSGIKRIILWDFPRASWPYDVIVILILAFIFFTPRELFRDDPKVNKIVMLPAEGAANVFWIEPELLTGIPEPGWKGEAARLIKSPNGKKQRILRVERIFDSEQETKGYMAFTSPQ